MVNLIMEKLLKVPQGFEVYNNKDEYYLLLLKLLMG